VTLKTAASHCAGHTDRGIVQALNVLARRQPRLLDQRLDMRLREHRFSYWSDDEDHRK